MSMPHSPLAAIVRARRTIHAFEPRVPPLALVEEALALACWAPNHHRTEPWRFTVLGPDTARRVSELNAQLVQLKNGAEAAAAKLKRWLEMPGWLVVTCQRSDDAQREREDYAATCCVLQNLGLLLWEAGIGMKWTTGKVTRDPRFLAMVGAEATQESCVGLVWYGYPAEVPAQVRRPLAELLRVLP